MDKINLAMEAYMENNEIAGASIAIRQGDNLVYNKVWGYSDIKKKKPVTSETVYRLASMTKVVTAVGILKLQEMGLLNIDDPLSNYLPEFKNMRVQNDERYTFKEGMNMASLLPKILTFRMDKVKSVPSDREITIRDLLSHASGLQQGIVGMIQMQKHNPKDTLEERVKEYSKYCLDFQPGTSTSYSPCAAFDILGYLIGKLLSLDTASAYEELIFKPLKMDHSTFNLKDRTNLSHTYIRENNKLVDVTGTKKDIDGIMCNDPLNPFVAGSAGLYSTLSDYEKLGKMLLNNGDGYLKEESVKAMRTEAQEKHLVPEEGQVWGLGVRIREEDKYCTKGTYGWSGALGTHFFVSPVDNLECVFLTSRADLGGSGSYISRKVEELVFEEWKK